VNQQKFTIRYDFDELLAATWLKFRRQWVWQGAMNYVGAVTAIMTAIMEATANEHTMTGFIANAMAGMVVAVACLVVTMLFWLWSVPRSVRKSYEQLSLDGGSVAFTLDDEHVEIADATTTLNLPWGRWIKWTENKDFLLLYRSDAYAHYIPKDQVRPETIEIMIAHLDSAGVKKL
jgi:hypothetical protein